MQPSTALRTKWWLALPVMVLTLLLVDVGLRQWHPRPERLPDQFSPSYLEHIVADRRNEPNLVVFLGDSVLWGYGLPEGDAAPSVLSRSFRKLHALNLSYEGGSSANTYFMLDYLLSRGLQPDLIVFNVNSKETNPEDSAYRRLHPSLERIVGPLITTSDRSRLTLQPPPTFSQQLGYAMEQAWQLYRYRVDIREALFGDADLASAVSNATAQITGAQQRKKALHRPTPARFMGTYDLSPLGDDNVNLFYLRKTVALIRAHHLRAIAFLTPTNHRLLADYINVPEYDQKLATLRNALADRNITVLNLDRAIQPDDFIDNDHLTVQGNMQLAATLRPVIERSARDL